MSDPYFTYVINSSLVNFTNHVHKNSLSIVWFCCQVSDHITNVSSYELSWSLLLIFIMGIFISTSVFWMSSSKKDLVWGPFYKLHISFWYPAVAELKNFGFSCVVVEQQYSLNFIILSHFHFNVFGTMAEIFLLAAFSYSAFAFLLVLAFVYFTVSPFSIL